MRVAVVNTHIPFVRGGAELLAEGLVREIRKAGHEAELVGVPFRWYPPEKVLDHALASSLIDLSAFGDEIDRCICLKFPAYLVQHPRKSIWLLHQHRQAYDLWNTPWTDLSGTVAGGAVREAIMAMDDVALRGVETLCTISENVTSRLLRFNGIEATTLYHPPPLAEDLRCDEYGDYLFFPSRLSLPKRQELVLEALAATRHPVEVVFSGAADDAATGKRFIDLVGKLGLERRARWLGPVDAATLVEHYARCRAVVYTPFDEDYGYVTLEAMLARKAVITLADSGGPTEFIRNDVEGLVADPTAGGLAAAMDAIWASPDRARRMGEMSFARYGALDISWASVIAHLLA